jgi:hypothetical protein
MLFNNQHNAETINTQEKQKKPGTSFYFFESYNDIYFWGYINKIDTMKKEIHSIQLEDRKINFLHLLF